MEKHIEQIDGRPRIVVTMDIPWGELKIDGSFSGTASVKLKRLNALEIGEASKVGMKASFFGNGQSKVDMDQFAINQAMVLKSIVEAPFTISAVEVGALDQNQYNPILNAVNELNGLTAEKKAN